ncbi:MAG TPA: EVE domain-containing protein, partial [Rubricoccaceae bacterium]|nr:EVE domain-containing protein [Rubricoccaceae bacterium]
AFTLELDASDLAQWAEAGGGEASVEPWPAEAWAPRAIRLGGLGDLSKAERGVVQAAVDAVVEAHALLAPAGLGAGYRARDEVALFALHASETPDTFRTTTGEPVDPLDLALFTKLLPRLEGGRAPVREAVLALLGWAVDGTPRREESPATALLDGWEGAGRSDDFPGARFPRTAARLARMADALLSEGFASFWT